MAQSVFQYNEKVFQTTVVPVDGNCLFSCFSLILYGHLGKQNTVRNEIVNYITSKWIEFSNFIWGDDTYNKVILNSKSFYDHMSQDGVYGGAPEILAACNLYNLNVNIYYTDRVPQKFSSNQFTNVEFNLLFTGKSLDGGHFTLLSETSI